MRKWLFVKVILHLLCDLYIRQIKIIFLPAEVFVISKLLKFVQSR